MNQTFKPDGPLRGSVTPPADKSISHRAALFGAMTLWIAGDDQAERARELISGLGFPVGAE